jgi:hypothetical protein
MEFWFAQCWTWDTWTWSFPFWIFLSRFLLWVYGSRAKHSRPRSRLKKLNLGWSTVISWIPTPNLQTTPKPNRDPPNKPRLVGQMFDGLESNHVELLERARGINASGATAFQQPLFVPLSPAHCPPSNVTLKCHPPQMLPSNVTPLKCYPPQMLPSNVTLKCYPQMLPDLVSFFPNKNNNTCSPPSTGVTQMRSDTNSYTIYSSFQ